MLYDATSPYGYPSPLLAGGESQEKRTAFLDRALKSLLAALRQRRVVSLYLRLHPLLPLPREPFCRQGTLVRHGETVFVDLTQSEQEWWRQTRRSTGTISIAPSAWDTLPKWTSTGAAWTSSLNSTPIRCGGSTRDPDYFFSREYFHRLRDVLGDKLHLGIVRIGDKLVCAGLFSEVCGIVQFHLAGRREETDVARPHEAADPFRSLLGERAWEPGLSSWRGTWRSPRLALLLQIRVLQRVWRVPHVAGRRRRRRLSGIGRQPLPDGRESG